MTFQFAWKSSGLLAAWATVRVLLHEDVYGSKPSVWVFCYSALGFGLNVATQWKDSNKKIFVMKYQEHERTLRDGGR
jgi:hypothetical protein